MFLTRLSQDGWVLCPHDRGLLEEEEHEVDLSGNLGYRGVIGQTNGKIVQSTTLSPPMSGLAAGWKCPSRKAIILAPYYLN